MNTSPCILVTLAALLICAGPAWGGGMKPRESAPVTTAAITCEGTITKQEFTRQKEKEKEKKVAPDKVLFYLQKADGSSLLIAPDACKSCKPADGKEVKLEDFVDKAVKITGTTGTEKSGAVTLIGITTIVPAAGAKKK